MTSYRTAAVGALLGALPCLFTALAAQPAQAHGAPTDPVSRTFACSPDGGGAARSAACRAARAANGPEAADWDNLRIAGVAGEDRERVPDGKLCSGGLEAYRGLDLARADWPSTRLPAGAELTLTYRSTIPHTGTFELYLTKEGYAPARPLKWSDLEAKPFATAKDPALVDDAYRIKATLPADRTGRQLLYTIWRNTSTPDTYYSCSDVVLGAAAPSSDAPSSEAANPPSRAAAPPSRDPAAASRATSANPATSGTSATSEEDDGDSTPVLLAGGASVLVLGVGVAATVRRRRPSR
ncbi:lytic polysaccharide monooxygenase auxiliary activity family 9 protein [Streptomyces antimycoticus]|uniref:lytic polysaccharide monooxygenase auxiliary activity family 9 protein n=1 Tax=Streptomyces antimycoticus TaxID=68175 RepID=UPI00256FB2B3|nr:lytic polysaccharide monooxygenase [Streptomyces antimycoticus]WJE01608.1 lytic polysaccharide monooxygenase [Streptomyces antimycoticus]